MNTDTAVDGDSTWSQQKARFRPAYQLGTIVMGAWAACYTGSLLGPFQETLRAAIALTDNQMAILQGPTLHLPAIIAGIPIGIFIDRFSRTRLLTVFIAVQILGTTLTAIAPNFLTFLAARVIVGLMISATAMNCGTLLASWVSPERRGRAFTFMGIAQTAGIAAAFVLGGKLAAYFGTGSQGWRWAIAWLMIPVVAVFVATLGLQEPPRGEGRDLGGPLRLAVRELWQLRRMVLTLSVGPIVVGMSFMAALVWAAPIITRHFGLPPDRVGAIIGAVVLGSGVLGYCTAGVLADFSQRSGGPRQTVGLMIGLATLQIPACFFGVMPELVGTVLLLALLSILTNMKSTLCSTVTTLVIPNHLRGLCFGLQNAFAAIFVSLSPVLVSILSTAIGGPAKVGEAFAMIGVATTLFGLVTLALGRRSFPAMRSAGAPVSV